MKANHLDNIINAVKSHIIEALTYFYKNSEVGDNPLKLKEPLCVVDKNITFIITGIEMMFDENVKGEMCFCEEPENDESLSAKYPLRLLQVQSLSYLLSSLEEQLNCHYDSVIELDIIKLSK